MVVNGTATGTAIYVLIKNFSYPIVLSKDRNWSIVGENVISAQGLVSGVTVTRPSDNTLLYVLVESGTTVKTTVQPQIEKGSTPTAWEPYENIRPIKGRDSVTVERCGENLLNIKPVNEIVGRPTIKNDNGWLQVDGEFQGGNLWLATGYVLRPGTYCAYLFGGDSMQDNGVLWIYGNVQALMEPKHRKAILTVKNTSKVNVYLHANRPFTLTTKFAVAIVSGSTAPTTYTPYIGQTNTLTLPETVYGGEVDAVSGAGESQYNMVNIRMEKLNYNGTISAMLGFASSNILNDIQLPPSNRDTFEGVCDCLPIKPASEINNGTIGLGVSASGDIYLRAEGLDSKEAYAAKFPDGVNVCYKAATPTSFSATGNASVKALSGTNTVLTDADSATVTGRADPIKRIEDLEAAVASIN